MNRHRVIGVGKDADGLGLCIYDYVCFGNFYSSNFFDGKYPQLTHFDFFFQDGLTNRMKDNGALTERFVQLLFDKGIINAKTTSVSFIDYTSWIKSYGKFIVKDIYGEYKPEVDYTKDKSYVPYQRGFCVSFDVNECKSEEMFFVGALLRTLMLSPTTVEIFMELYDKYHEVYDTFTLWLMSFGFYKENSGDVVSDSYAFVDPKCLYVKTTLWDIQKSFTKPINISANYNNDGCFLLSNFVQGMIYSQSYVYRKSINIDLCKNLDVVLKSKSSKAGFIESINEGTNIDFGSVKVNKVISILNEGK